MLNQYKVKELVTNILDVGDYYDPSLYGSSGIAMSNDHTIWIANVGNDSSVERNVTHYDLYGVKMSETLPFIDYESPDPLVPPSQQRQLIVDLLWLQKNVLAQRDGIIMPMPKMYALPPILGKPAVQPSPEELSMRKFYNKPNGYLGPSVDITYLINFSINNPLPLKTPAGKQATKILSDAHNQVYKKLIIDWSNQTLIRQYGGLLMEAQMWLSLGAKNAKAIPNVIGDMKPMVKLEAFPMSEPNKTLPIGLCYNQSRGFVGYQFNKRRCSCDLIAVTESGSIYVYSPLIQTGGYYGMVTVLNNSSDYCVYTGITMTNNMIYITDFANRRIDVYDFGWVNQQDITESGFIDPELPNDYSPFNILAYNNLIYITYAKIDLASPPPYNKVVYGAGLGIINVFTLNGKFVKRAVTGGELNAPWGLTFVKHHFANGKLLVANHGDGEILIYDSDWKYVGKLQYKNYAKSIIGLYGICSIYEDVYFTSSPTGIVNGLVGKIKKSQKCCCPTCPTAKDKEITTLTVMKKDVMILKKDAKSKKDTKSKKDAKSKSKKDTKSKNTQKNVSDIKNENPVADVNQDVVAIVQQSRMTPKYYYNYNYNYLQKATH
jgi:uncharacterized protein (TIGR03118 family)